MRVGETLKWVFHCVQDRYEEKFECLWSDDHSDQTRLNVDDSLYHGLPADAAVRAVWATTRARSGYDASWP